MVDTQLRGVSTFFISLPVPEAEDKSITFFKARRFNKWPVGHNFLLHWPKGLNFIFCNIIFTICMKAEHTLIGERDISSPTTRHIQPHPQIGHKGIIFHQSKQNSPCISNLLSAPETRAWSLLVYLIT